MKKLLNKLFSRMVITCLLVAAQLIFFMVEVFKLQQYYVLVAAILHLLSFIAVMHLLLKDVNPSIKLAWIVPILMFPVLPGLIIKYSRKIYFFASFRSSTKSGQTSSPIG